MKLKTARQVPLAILLFTMLFGLSVSAGRCESPPPVFSTWYIFEVDKLASIWLVKRFVHPEAEIRLYSKGEPILKGIPFDTPDAHFRRYHNASTYEMFRRHYKIEDPRCIYISRIVPRHRNQHVGQEGDERVPPAHRFSRANHRGIVEFG